jgi:hypothetical protein
MAVVPTPMMKKIAAQTQAIADVVLREDGRVGAEQGGTGWREQFHLLDGLGESWRGACERLVTVGGLGRLVRNVERAQAADDAAHRCRPSHR